MQVDSATDRKIMNQLIVIADRACPVVAAGDRAQAGFREFFVSQILSSNPHRAYAGP
jgi:hypothetical protein